MTLGCRSGSQRWGVSIKRYRSVSTVSFSVLLQVIYAYSRSVEVLHANRGFLLPNPQTQLLLPLFEPQELVNKKKSWTSLY